MAKREMGRLERARRDRGVSREALARKADVSVSTLYNAEVRNVTPRRAQQRTIAFALGVRPSELWPEPARRAA